MHATNNTTQISHPARQKIFTAKNNAKFVVCLDGTFCGGLAKKSLFVINEWMQKRERECISKHSTDNKLQYSGTAKNVPPITRSHSVPVPKENQKSIFPAAAAKCVVVEAVERGGGSDSKRSRLPLPPPILASRAPLSGNSSSSSSIVRLLSYNCAAPPPSISKNAEMPPSHFANIDDMDSWANVHCMPAAITMTFWASDREQQRCE